MELWYTNGEGHGRCFIHRASHQWAENGIAVLWARGDFAWLDWARKPVNDRGCGHGYAYLFERVL